MKQSLFERRHKAEWERFSRLLEQLERDGKVTDAGSFPKDYRRLCQHLALARERGYSSFLIDSLQQQVLRGHQQLYRHRSRLGANALAFVLQPNGFFGPGNGAAADAAFTGRYGLLVLVLQG